jgi:simple sugar transport system permease protein
MMIVGAACGFAGAFTTGSVAFGALCGILGGAALSAVFAALTLGLAANQVASGLALTILGVGLSGLIGADYVGQKITGAANLYIPYLADIPFVGRVLLGQNAFVYLSVALVIGIWYFLYRSRAGLVLRAVGDNHASAHALAYTPFWVSGMTAGRGWIALALVVFASWMPFRLMVGAYLFGGITILQLHAQATGMGIPSQLMSSLPYLATIVVLVVISAVRGRAGSPAPASLGLAFIPDR